MTTPGTATERAWLTVIAWPGDVAAHNQLLERLAESLNSDVPTMRHHADRSPPTVIGWYPHATAASALALIHETGGEAMLMAMNDIESLGPTFKIKDVRIEPKGLTFECWRGEPVIIDPKNVDVIVRATLREDQSRPSSITTLSGQTIDTAQPMTGYGLEGWAMREEAAHQFQDWSVADRQIKTSHKLDVHVQSTVGLAGVYQIDADKFAFRILGDLRGRSDNVNIDRMCEFFHHLNSNVIIDAYFPLWKPPPGAQRLRLPMMQYNKEDPSFAFYSRWATLIYRHLKQ